MVLKENSKILICILYVLFSVSGLVVIKIGNSIELSRGFTIPFINLHLSLISVLGILFYGISFCLYMGVVANFDIGFIIPLLGGIINILILVASIFILKEGLSMRAVIGALIVVFGIAVMNS